MDDQAFEQLAATHYPRIRRAALLLSNGDPWEADDLAQETILRAADGWKRFTGQSRVETWLYGILLNCRRQRQRSLGRNWKQWLAWLIKGDRPFMTEPADARMLAEEWNTSLWSKVAELVDFHREVIVLRFAEGLAYEEIAAVLHCPVGTVKSRLHNALATLQQELAEHVGP